MERNLAKDVWGSPMAKYLEYDMLLQGRDELSLSKKKERLYWGVIADLVESCVYLSTLIIFDFQPYIK